MTTEEIAYLTYQEAVGIRDRIKFALTKFAQGTPAVDDITLLIVRWKGRKGASAQTNR